MNELKWKMSNMVFVIFLSREKDFKTDFVTRPEPLDPSPAKIELTVGMPTTATD